MSTFTPPVDTNVGFRFLPDSPLHVKRGLAHFPGCDRARTVILYDSDTQVIEGAMPPGSYNTDGSLLQSPTERVSATFLGARGAYTVTALQAATLTAAGYTIGA